jgi:hypothetical protein
LRFLTRLSLPQVESGSFATILLLFCSAILPACLSGIATQAFAQNQTSVALPSEPPRFWIEQAAANEQHIIEADGTFPLRYRQRKVDAKGDTTREIIESREGAVARLIERNGQPITASEDTGERQRLTDALASPADFIKHHKRDSGTRSDVLSLVRLIPQAMTFTYVPGQPQPQNATSRQIVIDFQPDPKFKPPTILSSALTGLAGRFWIDERTHQLTRGEAHVLHTVDFGWGILGSIHPGGTVEFEQADAGSGRWVYSHVDAHLVFRVLVKTVPENTLMTNTNFRQLPAQISYQDAIHILLAMPIPLK